MDGLTARLVFPMRTGDSRTVRGCALSPNAWWWKTLIVVAWNENSTSADVDDIAAAFWKVGNAFAGRP